MTPARTKGWIKSKALHLIETINTEIAARWPNHCDLTYDKMVQEVIEKHLWINWEYITLEKPGEPTQVLITKYTGEVAEPGYTKITCRFCRSGQAVLTKIEGQQLAFECQTCNKTTVEELP